MECGGGEGGRGGSEGGDGGGQVKEGGVRGAVMQQPGEGWPRSLVFASWHGKVGSRDHTSRGMVSSRACRRYMPYRCL